MRIDYNILYIEDTASWLEPKIDITREYLEDRGFNLVHERIEKFEVRDFSKYDLIAIDYQLSNGETGVNAIETIRKSNNLYTEILFYSMTSDAILRSELAKKSIDGVYCSHRGDFITKLHKLIDITIRKTQELNNLRGLVMAEEAELQTLTEKILRVVHSKDKIANFIREHGHHSTSKFLTDNLAKVKALKPQVDFEKLLEMPGVYGGFGKIMTLHQFLKNDFSKDTNFVPRISIMDNYRTEVVEMRNKLAHSVEGVASDGTLILVHKSGVHNFTENTFIEIRKNLKKHKQNLKDILVLIEGM